MHVIATAGHVDHGKSTLVRALTGIDPDRFEEEKRRGLTIDLGFAWCTLPSGLEIGIVDVPGHERFIRNMLAGVGAVDAVLFVVAADEGWMPQSEEHLRILELLGVEHGVIALTKSDIAGDLADEAEADVRAHLNGTPLDGAHIVRVSATTGEGLDQLLTSLDNALEEAPVPDEAVRTRLWIDRSFSIKGAGTVVTGTLHGGPLRVGQAVTIVPAKREARIRSMQTHGRDVDEATGPRRLALNLVGLDRRSIHRGDALVDGEWIVTDRFAARLRPLHEGFTERGAYELFVGTAETPCRVRKLSDERDPLVEIFTEAALPVIPGDRFVIRDVGRWDTVAGGVVIDNAPPRLRRGAVANLQAREGLVGADLDAFLERQAGEERAALTERVLAAVEAFHAANPLAPGMPIGELELGAAALDAIPSVVVEGNLVRLATHAGPSLTPAERNDVNRALNLLRNADASPPELDDIGLTQELARALERSGELVFLTPNIAYPSDVWADIEKRVVGFIVDNGSATVSQIREAIGTTRKYAIPLLEKLDATGITRRKGDARELGPRGREVAPNTVAPPPRSDPP